MKTSDKIIQALRSAAQPQTNSQLAASTGLSTQQVRCAVQRLRKAQILTQSGSQGRAHLWTFVEQAQEAAKSPAPATSAPSSEPQPVPAKPSQSYQSARPSVSKVAEAFVGAMANSYRTDSDRVPATFEELGGLGRMVVRGHRNARPWSRSERLRSRSSWLTRAKEAAQFAAAGMIWAGCQGMRLLGDRRAAVPSVPDILKSLSPILGGGGAAR